MGMTQEQMDQWLTSKVETIVAEQLGNITQQLEDLFNQSLEAYTATIVAGKIAGKLDDELVKAYERMVLAEAKRIIGREPDIPDFPQEYPASDDDDLIPSEPSPFDDETVVVSPKAKRKLERIDDAAKSLEGGMDWPGEDDE